MFRPASTVSPLRTLHCFAGTHPTPLDRPPYDTAFGDGNFGYAIESAFGQSAGWDGVACDGDAAVPVGPFQTQEGAALGPIRRWNGQGQPDRPFDHSGDRLEAFGFAEARASRAVIDRASRHLFVAGHSWKSYPSEIGLTRIDARTGSTDTVWKEWGRPGRRPQRPGGSADASPGSESSRAPRPRRRHWMPWTASWSPANRTPAGSRDGSGCFG